VRPTGPFSATSHLRVNLFPFSTAGVRLGITPSTFWGGVGRPFRAGDSSWGAVRPQGVALGCLGLPRWGEGRGQGSGLASGIWRLGSSARTCLVRYAPKGQPVKARGGTPGTTPHDDLCALKGAHGTGCMWSPFAPLGRGVMGVGVTQGSASLHRWAVAVRRVAASPGAGSMSGECVANGTTADFRCQSPAVTTLD
jgi:hypothetical protein